MRAALIALLLTIASQAGAECGKLCDEKWWKNASMWDVQTELDAGVDVNSRTNYGLTPLHFAGGRPNPTIATTLLAAGADVMARTEDGVTPLHFAAWLGTPANIEVLLDAGADVMARTEILKRVRAPGTLGDIRQQLGAGTTPLHAATNYCHCTPVENIKVLLDAGADIKARNEAGFTPLHMAAWYGTVEHIQAMLAAGADVMARNEIGTTPLHRATWFFTPERIQTLLGAGADVMARDAYGMTPLHEAASYNSGTGVIEALLAAGADAKAKNTDGKTPWDYAQENEKLKGTKGYWALNDAQYN